MCLSVHMSMPQAVPESAIECWREGFALLACDTPESPVSSEAGGDGRGPNSPVGEADRGSRGPDSPTGKADGGVELDLAFDLD